MSDALYDKKEADALTESEKSESWRHEGEKLKASLILEHAGNIQSLLDIGCAWGQTLHQLVGKIPVLAGADESADRIESLRDNQHGIKTYQCRSTNLKIDDSSYDAILMSHILHEVKLFGNEDDLEKTLSEIRRVLTKDGAFIIIDHRDPGEGRVKIELGENKDNLLKFEERFKVRNFICDIDGNTATMSTRDCHDFVTKIWSIDKGAEDLEMNETHTVINEDEFADELEELNFKVRVSMPFNPITKMMDYYGIRLLEGEDWGRQVFMIATPSS